MTTRDDNPKVFISYSWSGPQHEEFVLNLAEKLMTDGVIVLLDKWDLKEGHDKYVFMEKMVTDSTVSKVLVISDKRYSSKADSRVGGVGTESQIISDEVYRKVNQEKFIPVVTEFDSGEPCLPAFLKSRIYIDLANEDRFYDEYEKLLRNIYSCPKIIKPVLGKAPSYLFDDSPTNLKTASIFSSWKDAITKEKQSAKKLGKDFLAQLIDSLELLRITDSENLDDKVLESISNFKPYRDQFIQYTQLLCDFDLLEDNKNDIYYLNSIRGQEIKEYCEFNKYILVLDENRKQRLKLNRISITADTLHDSADIKGISFDDIMQTDFILCLRSILHFDKYYQQWFPRTLVYKSGWSAEAFEIFIRAESPRYFEVVKKLLCINSKTELIERLDKAYEVYTRISHKKRDR